MAKKAPPIDPKKVRAVILREGRTIKWISEKCFLAHGTMRQLLTGQRQMTMPTFQLFLTALNAKPEEVLKDSSEASRAS